MWTEQFLKRGCLLVKTPEQGSKGSGIDKTLGSCSRACFLFVDAAHGGWQGFASSHRVVDIAPHRTSNVAPHRTSHRIEHRTTSDIGHRTSHRKISTSLQLVPEVVDPLRHSGVHGRKASAICTNCSASIERRQSWQIPWSFVTPFSFCLWLWVNRL